MIEFNCPECGNPIEVPDAVNAGVHTCPNCGAAVEPPDPRTRDAKTEPPGMETASNKSFTHADFVTGLQNETLGFFLDEPYPLLRGARRTIFTILWLLYVAAPPIIIPLWAYHVGNWWFLIGIAVSYNLSFSAGKFSKTIFGFACFCIGFWIHCGVSIAQYITFYFACALWGYMLWHLADIARMACARQSLIDSPRLFNWAVSQDTIRVVRLEMMEAEGASLAATGRFPLPMYSDIPVRVISNIVLESFNWVFGLPVGAVRLAWAHARGIKNLESKTADSIMRQLKSGTVGMVYLAVGYLLGYFF
jgi:hypothetical protein